MGSARKNDLQYVIAQQIFQLCRVEGWPAGHRLTERALAEQFQVSRSPVRLALDLLVEQSVVARTESGRYFLRVSGRDLDGHLLDLPQTEGEMLHEQILRDRFAERIPQQITEADLLRRYATTRGPLLKVLQRLSQEGMVDRGQGHGWIFRKILNSVEAHRASYEIRLMLEPQAMRSANFKIDRERVKRLLDVYYDFRDKKTWMDTAMQYELDAELHEIIASFSGNEFIVEVVQRHNQLRRVAEYELFYSDDRTQDSHDDHIQILEALLEGDVELAAILMTKHLYESSRLVGIFRKQSSSDAPQEPGPEESFG